MSKNKKAKDSKIGTPIILVINNPESLTYLNGNVVLESVFGAKAPVRVDLPPKDSGFGIVRELFWPQSSSSEMRSHFFERFPDVSQSQVPDFVRSAEFYEYMIGYILSQTGLKRKDLLRVKAVLASDDFYNSGSSLPELCRLYMPMAELFILEWRGSNPVRVNLSGDDLAPEG